MRLCFIATWIRPLFTKKIDTYQPGGGEVQLYFIGNKLSESKNYEVSYLVGNFGQAAREKYNAVLLYRGSKPLFGLAFYKTLFAVVKTVISLIRINADVYIDRTASPRVAVLALFSKLFKKKLIFMTAHEMDCSGEYERLNGAFMGRLYRYGLANSDLVITQSQTQQKMLKKHHNIDGVVLRSVYKMDNQPGPKKNYHLWVGRCTGWKQPEIFLDLAKRFPKENFVMIAPPAVHEELLFHSIQDQAGLMTNLTLYDGIDFHQIQRFFNEADLFINTSVYEGFPNTFIQAGIGQTPILSLNVNPDDFLDRVKGGLCANGDQAILFSNFEQLLNDRELWQEFSKGIFDYVKQHHDIKHLDHKFMTLLTEIQ